MDWLDYREKLGIAFSDTENFRYFKTKICNALTLIGNSPNSGGMDFAEYSSFCNITGTPLDAYMFDGFQQFNRCLMEIKKQDDIKNFISYYIALIQAIKTERPGNYKKKDFENILESMLKQSHIPYEVLQDDNGVYIFPKGVPELDDALVSQPLTWMSKYPNSQKAWIKALRGYSEVTDESASEVADKFRKALETFFREFFAVDKSLENCKKEYGSYLKERGVPSEISGNFETLLQAYTNYMNGYAKHRDNTSRNVLEYLMYQTGNIIRLLITLE